MLDFGGGKFRVQEVIVPIFGVSATHHFCSEPLYCGNHEGFGTDGKPRKIEVILAFTGIPDGVGRPH